MLDPLWDLCPSFQPVWRKSSHKWTSEIDALRHFAALTELARHLIGMLENEDTARLKQVFDLVESWHLAGDQDVRIAATCGLLADLQNPDFHQGSTRPDNFVDFLQPESRFWWKKLRSHAENGTPIVDDRPKRNAFCDAPEESLNSDTGSDRVTKLSRFRPQVA